MKTLFNALKYNPENGHFTWASKPSRRVRVGAIAGGVDLHGYRIIRLAGKPHKAHRLAWVFIHGDWPAGDIDHINGDRDDNRIENLRETTRTENIQNQKKAHKNSQTGFLGVFPNGKKFVAMIRMDGKQKYLGYYETPEEAYQRYLMAKREHHAGNTL